MKNIIKKINLLAIGAMIVGGGFAFATINDDPTTPNVYLHPEDGWTALNGMKEGVDYDCNSTNPGECTAYAPNLSNPAENLTLIKEGTVDLFSK